MYKCQQCVKTYDWPGNLKRQKRNEWRKLPCVIAVTELGYSMTDTLDAVAVLKAEACALNTDEILEKLFNCRVIDNEEKKKLRERNTVYKSTCRVIDNEEKQKLRESIEVYKSTMMCKVCLDKCVGDLFLPCRHLVCCVNCSASLHRCPVCRENIVAVIKTFV